MYIQIEWNRPGFGRSFFGSLVEEEHLQEDQLQGQISRYTQQACYFFERTHGERPRLADLKITRIDAPWLYEQTGHAA